LRLRRRGAWLRPNPCSRPKLSRLENAPSLTNAIRLIWALVDQGAASYEWEPASVVRDIDDTWDLAHGHQQLSLFNAHCDDRCFLPIHAYDTERSCPVAVVLGPGTTPSGVVVRAHPRRLVRRTRRVNSNRPPTMCAALAGTTPAKNEAIRIWVASRARITSARLAASSIGAGTPVRIGAWNGFSPTPNGIGARRDESPLPHQCGSAGIGRAREAEARMIVLAFHEQYMVHAHYMGQYERTGAQNSHCSLSNSRWRRGRTELVEGLG